jgi:hypothetical protein
VRGGSVVRDSVVRVGAVLAGGVIAVGCQFVLPSSPSVPPEIEFPNEPEALYKTGRASIALSDGSGTELLRMEPDSGFHSEAGALAGWTDDTGWSLRLNVPVPNADGGADPISIRIVRETEGGRWTAGTADDCDIELERADTAGIMGSAKCSGLRWEPEGGAATDEAPPNLGPFDADITFEAQPQI